MSLIKIPIFFSLIAFSLSEGITPHVSEAALQIEYNKPVTCQSLTPGTRTKLSTMSLIRAFTSFKPYSK